MKTGIYERIMDIFVKLVMVAVMCMHNYVISYPGWHCWYCDSTIMSWMIQGLTPGRGKKFFSSYKCPDQLSGTHPASCVLGTRGIKLPAHLHLVPRFRMRGATPTLLLYAFMACIGTILPCPVFNYFGCSVILFCCVGYCSDAVLNVM
jgi:hypothetical protein